jgi:ammonia channel protein AmtB
MAEVKIETRIVELPDGPAVLPVAYVDADGVSICVALLAGRLISVHKHPYRAAKTYAHVPDARPITVCSRHPSAGVMGRVLAALTATQEVWEIVSR